MWCSTLSKPSPQASKPQQEPKFASTGENISTGLGEEAAPTRYTVAKCDVITDVPDPGKERQFLILVGACMRWAWKDEAVVDPQKVP